MALHISTTSEDWRDGYQDAFHGRTYNPPKKGAGKYKRGYATGRRHTEDHLAWLEQSLQIFADSGLKDEALIERYKSEAARYKQRLIDTMSNT